MFNFKKATKINFSINLLTISDTHNMLKEVDLENLPDNQEFDLCILLGDISKSDIEKIIKRIPTNKIIGILGNHDDLDNLEKYNIQNINTKEYDINGIKITGLEGCIKYKPTQPGYTLEESFNVCKKLPKAQILISHNIPYKFMGTLNQSHIGNPAINKYLKQNKVPLNICGHNHNDIQGTLHNGTKVIETYYISLIKITPKTIEVRKI